MRGSDLAASVQDHTLRRAPVVLITAARDEAAHIRALVESVAAQTVRPLRWIIVDDGSTDGTGAIAQRAADEHADHLDVEVLLRLVDDQRSFSSKASAFMFGVEHLRETDPGHEFIACVDADVRLPPTYLEEVLGRFERNPRLGVAGGRYRHEVNGRLVLQPAPPQHVPGPSQVFRREAFEQIGGYRSLRFGGVDTVANVAARQHGWETRSWAEIVVEHDRRMGTGGGRHPVAAEFAKGRQDHDLGLTPLFELGKLARRLDRHPRVLGAVARLAGYVWQTLSPTPRSVDRAYLAHTRAEQRGRIRGQVDGLARRLRSARAR